MPSLWGIFVKEGATRGSATPEGEPRSHNGGGQWKGGWVLAESELG